MVKRINKLTRAQKARLAEWRDKWIAIGLSTERADRAKFEAAVGAYYDAANLSRPKRVVWVTSPFAGAFAFPAAALILGARNRASVDAGVRASVRDRVSESVGESVDASVGDSVRDSVRDRVSESVGESVDASVGDSVRDSVRDRVSESVGESVDASVGDSVRDSVSESVGESVDASVGDSVRDSVRDSVCASVRDSVRASVRDSVDASVDASVRDSVGASVDASVDASVHDSVRASVRDSVGASVRASVDAQLPIDANVLDAYRSVLTATWYRYLGGQFWVGYGWGYWASPSMLSYLRDVCRLEFGAVAGIVDAIIAIGESACWWWPHKDFVMVCERPTLLHRDEFGRLHSETTAAIAWPDGWGVHSIHGIRVPSWVVEHPDRITVDAIHGEQNAEVRRVMVERYGISRYVRDAQFEVLDADKDPLGLPRRLLHKGDVLVVELTNSTEDADGTRRVYHVSCHPELRPLLHNDELGEPQKLTALNAVASTYGMTGAEYVLECET